MYIAMNRFEVVLGKENDFENLWRNRESNLDSVPGFTSFSLLRGESFNTHTLYASHTTWENKQSFLNWTKSDSFRKSHKGAGTHKNLYLGHPQFEGFEVIN
tara:strand:- start:88 stop:390 length:303 start_codon:yes stop_codon:yes gene_type:complete